MPLLVCVVLKRNKYRAIIAICGAEHVPMFFPEAHAQGSRCLFPSGGCGGAGSALTSTLGGGSADGGR